MYGIRAADSAFSPARDHVQPSLLDIYASVLLNRRQHRTHGCPVAFETKYGWVLAGGVNSSSLSYCSVVLHHVSIPSNDEPLHKF